MERQVMHMDLDSFFVSVERQLNPALEGKPVLVGGSSDRGVVASCSYEARSFGIHSAMPMRMARQLCPDAIVVKGDHDKYSEYSDQVTDIIRENVPVYEKASIDEFYVDMTGMDKFFGCYKLATEIRQKIIRETNLPISFALSSNKTVAKIGTGEIKPNNQQQIPFGTEKTYLGPLSIKKIPGVGEKTYQLLRGMGIEKVCTVQEMPVQVLQQVLGENGMGLWRKANGIDNSPVEQYNERKSISTECTFEKDTIDVDHLKRVLLSMTEKLCFQLRNEEKLTGCVTVKIRYSDFNTYTMQMRVPYTTMDNTLIEKVKELFDKLFQKRMLIRLIGIKFSHLIQGTYQIDMFSDTAEQIQLYAAMDKLRQRFGEDAVMRAAGLGLNKRETSLFNGIKKLN
ncbi:DNA polymerase IV [Aurantibacillus circumpalustris]|uniref:DNA polymerase IV n=1 Tax=Aurantibacillus circumpalustris TaxID=3036359 RepID=UPI00295AA4D1|nr:DNA polymerase IV [Aurantibacillus circumpalustris]